MCAALAQVKRVFVDIVEIKIFIWCIIILKNAVVCSVCVLRWYPRVPGTHRGRKELDPLELEFTVTWSN